MTFEPNFYIDDFGHKAMSLADYDGLTNEQKQELDRNFWRYGGIIWGEFYFKPMTEEERAMFAGQEMRVY